MMWQSPFLDYKRSAEVAPLDVLRTRMTPGLSAPSTSYLTPSIGLSGVALVPSANDDPFEFLPREAPFESSPSSTAASLSVGAGAVVVAGALHGLAGNVSPVVSFALGAVAVMLGAAKPESRELARSVVGGLAGVALYEKAREVFSDLAARQAAAALQSTPTDGGPPRSDTVGDAHVATAVSPADVMKARPEASSPTNPPR